MKTTLLACTVATACAAAAAGAAAPPLPCAMTGQSYKPLRSPWIHAGPAGYTNDAGDVAGGGGLVSAGAVQQAVATSDGACTQFTVTSGYGRLSTAVYSTSRPAYDIAFCACKLNEDCPSFFT